VSEFFEAITAAARSSARSLISGEPTSPAKHSWANVHSRAKRLAGGLAANGVGISSRVAILASNPEEIAPLLQAVWMRGGTAATLQHPTRRTDILRWITDTRALLDMVEAEFVVVGDLFAQMLPVLGQEGIRAASASTLEGNDVASTVESDDDDTALLQFTSGSTGQPKAVVITHRNLQCHNNALATVCQLEPKRDVTVSWLPMFHDMGLIGCLLFPMWAGIDAVCTTPSEYLRAPSLWPNLITKYRGTGTAAPNFAYSMLTAELRRAHDASFDLSSLRFVLNGAEPVDAATINNFLAVGHRFGLRDTALIAAYGMAEATLAISCTELSKPVGLDSITGYTSGTAPPAIDRGPNTRQLVELGHPIPGVELQVVGTEGRLGSRHIGELEIRGESVSRGYVTSEGFESCRKPDGWFPTGDIGYLTESGAVVVCGRRKEMIIVAGRNIFPAEIERFAAHVQGVRPGNIVAIPTPGLGRRERFIIAVESELHDNSKERQRIAHEVALAVYKGIGAGPDLVAVIAPRTIPKTSSGKPRRNATLEMLVESGFELAS